MPSRKSIECPKSLAVLMNLCNMLPDPFVYPRGYERAPDSEPDWSIVERPIEARLVHPEVIKAECRQWFNVAFAYDRDPTWAAKFEQLFYEKAGHFNFNSEGVGWPNESPAQDLFRKFPSQHSRYRSKIYQRMAKTLEPFVIDWPTTHTERDPQDRTKFIHTHGTKEVLSYRLLLIDRIAYCNLPKKLIDYVEGEIEPFTYNGEGKPTDLERYAEERWFQLWSAFYNFPEITNIEEGNWVTVKAGDVVEPKPRMGMIDTGRHRMARHVDIGINQDGFIKPVMDDLLLRILTNHDIPSGRVRTCKECKDLFWAKRLDQNCCGKKCTNAYHVRKFRQKGKDEWFSKLPEKIGVQAHVLRYWESEFPTLARLRAIGSTFYEITALQIKGLLYDEQLTIKEAKKILRVPPALDDAGLVEPEDSQDNAA